MRGDLGQQRPEEAPRSPLLPVALLLVRLQAY
jgi:hypothetical protein